MKIIDVLLIGVPETITTLLVGLCFLRSTDKEKNAYFKIFIKIIVSVILILSAVFIRANRFNHVAINTIFSTLIYMITYKLVWRFNIKQSTIKSIVGMFSLIAAETITYPIANALIEYKIFSDSLIIYTNASRIFQIILILFMIKNKKEIHHSFIIKKEWNNLNIQNKISLVLLILAVALCIMFNVNYEELYDNLNGNVINFNRIALSLNVIFVLGLIFMLIVVLLIKRTSRLEEYERILDKSPYELFKDICDIADEKELKKYKCYIELYIEEKFKGGETNEKG